MITLSEVTMDDVSYLKGKIGKQNYVVLGTTEVKEKLKAFSTAADVAESFEDVAKIEKEALEFIDGSNKENADALSEILKDDLYYNDAVNEYYIKVNGKIGKDAVHSFIVDKMRLAVEKELSPKPWLMFWVRLMRNKLYRKDSVKVTQLMNYLEASYTDKENIKKLVEQGYSEKVAEGLSIFDQISITETGLLAAFKYVSLVDHKFVVEKDEKTGEQSIVKKDKYERKLEVDELTGVVLSDKLALPTSAEDFDFLPPIMGTGGDAFLKYSIDDAGQQDKKEGHLIGVGKIHELPKGFAQVNCEDSSSGVKGLHLGGYYYVQGFGGQTAYLVDCLVAPEDIGAVCDVDNWRHNEGAIRCRKYYVTGAHFAVNRGLYHPNKYSNLLNDVWEAAKMDSIAGLEAKKQKLVDQA